MGERETDWSTEAIVARRDQYYAASQRAFVPYKTPMIFRRGQGQYLWDEAGKKYTDLLGMNVCVSVGHAHPKVTAAVQAQVAELQHCTTMFYHPVPAHFAEELAAELVGGGEVGGRGEVFAVFGEDEGIDAAIEAGEVVEGEGGGLAGDFDGGGFFPLPVFAGGAEFVIELLAVDGDFKAAGGAGGIEGADPVFGAGPEGVGAGGEVDGGGGVFDGLAHAVGHEVGGAHDIDELGVEDPAAGGGEGFGLEPEGLRVGRSGGAEGEEGGEEGGFHG